MWKGTDKVTRLSTINDYETGDLKMMNLECMIKSLRLAWLKRIFSSSRGTWKSYLRHLLAKYSGVFLFNCNFDVKASLFFLLHCTQLYTQLSLQYFTTSLNIINRTYGITQLINTHSYTHIHKQVYIAKSHLFKPDML